IADAAEGSSNLPRSVRWALLAAFATGVVVGWQAARARRRFLRWRQSRLQRRLDAARQQLEAA
uniref:Mitoregulin n=1 Tax=Coturnix japonica TaxID=93934 RepID=A0A8C2TZ84_COTJA